MRKHSSGFISTGIALLLIARHHSNIRNLLAGTEPKIGKKAETAG